MRTALAVALATCALPSMAQALSIASLPPHKTEEACFLVSSLFKKIVAGNTTVGADAKRSTEDFLITSVSGRTSFFDGRLSIITDALGKVSADEMPALTSSLSSHDGKPDSRPATLEELRLVAKDEHNPLYIAVLSRDRWENERETDMDGMGQTERLPPGYEPHRSFWIVEFSSNQITTLREAGETYQLAYRNGAPNVCR